MSPHTAGPRGCCFGCLEAQAKRFYEYVQGAFTAVGDRPPHRAAPGLLRTPPDRLGNLRRAVGSFEAVWGDEHRHGRHIIGLLCAVPRG